MRNKNKEFEPLWEVLCEARQESSLASNTAQKILTAVSERMRNPQSIFKTKSASGLSQQHVKSILSEVNRLQVLVNGCKFPAPRFPDDKWDVSDFSKADLAWLTLTTCNVPRHSCLFYLIGLSVIDQDLSDQWRNLQSFVKKNMKEFGTPSPFATSARAWLENLAVLKFEPNKDNDFFMAYSHLLKGIKSYDHIIWRLMGVKNPVGERYSIEEATETLRKMTKRRRITTTQAKKWQETFRSLSNYVHPELAEHQRRTVSHPYFNSSINALREILRFAASQSSKNKNSIGPVDPAIETIYAGLGIQISPYDVVRKGLNKKKLPLTSPDIAFRDLRYARALLGYEWYRKT